MNYRGHPFAAYVLIIALGLGGIAPASAGLAEVPDDEDDDEEVAHVISGERTRFQSPGFFPVEQDDLRPADQLTLEIAARPLIIGGEFELAPMWLVAPTLGEHHEEDLARAEELLVLEFLYRLSDRTLAFVETELVYEQTWFADDRGDAYAARGIDRKQHWLFMQNLGGSPISVQVGRQNIAESREWWWDTELDALRIYADGETWQAEFSLAEELGAASTIDGFESQHQDVLRLIAQVKWRWAERHWLELFLLRHYDHSDHHRIGAQLAERRADAADADLLWLGFRQAGGFKLARFGYIYYWTDIGIVDGEQTIHEFESVNEKSLIVRDIRRREVSAWAIDSGFTWRTPLPDDPALSFAIAVGSGDSSPESGRSHAYQQTQLHDNNGKFLGVDRFHYYGEFLQPELSNLMVSTVSVGIGILEDSSIELAYHAYRQLHANDFMRNARLDTEPLGVDTDIGDALDLVIGIEESVHYEMELILSAFRAGRAFGTRHGEYSGSVQFKFNYNF